MFLRSKFVSNEINGNNYCGCEILYGKLLSCNLPFYLLIIPICETFTVCPIVCNVWFVGGTKMVRTINGKYGSNRFRYTIQFFNGGVMDLNVGHVHWWWRWQMKNQNYCFSTKLYTQDYFVRMTYRYIEWWNTFSVTRSVFDFLWQTYIVWTETFYNLTWNSYTERDLTHSLWDIWTTSAPTSHKSVQFNPYDAPMRWHRHSINGQKQNRWLIKAYWISCWPSKNPCALWNFERIANFQKCWRFCFQPRLSSLTQGWLRLNNFENRTVVWFLKSYSELRCRNLDANCTSNDVWICTPLYFGSGFGFDLHTCRRFQINCGNL